MGINNNPGVVADGLLLYVDAGNIKSYAGSGTTVVDMNGNVSGVLEGTGGFNAANNGSFVCNGTDTSINMGNILNLGTSDRTYSLWYKNSSTSQAGSTYLISKIDNNATSYRHALTVGTAQNFSVIFRASGNANYDSASMTNPSNDMGWHNIVLVIDRSDSYYLYQDGVLLGSKDISAVDGQNFTINRPLRIGSYNSATDASSGWFNGNISLCSIYSRALSVAEIKQNFNALRGRYGI